MSDLNAVTIVGRVVRDAEVKFTQAGLPIVNVSIANNQRAKQNNEWVDKANFFDVKLFGERFEKLAQYLTKGSRVGITGRLEHSTWDNKETGKKNSKVEVVATDVQLLGTQLELTDNPHDAYAAIPAMVASGSSVTTDDIPF